MRHVAVHATVVAKRVDGFRQMLSDILTVNATLVNQAQNEELKALSESTYTQNEQVKRISAWAAILFAPTLIGTVYGMNFSNIPELTWVFGYPFALGLMLLISGPLFVVFRRRGWLQPYSDVFRLGAVPPARVIDLDPVVRSASRAADIGSPLLHRLVVAVMRSP